MMLSILPWSIQLLFIPLLGPFFIGFTKKIKAKLQNRQGASCFQPYRDLWKLFHKEEVISHDHSWIFRLAPYLIFATTLAIGASIPLTTTAIAGANGDFLVILYLLALGVFFMALAGMDVGSAFGGFGSSREMFVVALTEGGLILSLATLAIFCNSTDLFSISRTIVEIHTSHIAPLLLAFMSFVIALLAETSRYPFDNPETHLELTMIHEAMILEYSGKRLALMEWASANKYLIFITLGANLFFPWGISQTQETADVFLALSYLLAKILIFCTGIAVLESTIAKFRLFRLPDLLFTSFIISVIAIGLIV